MIPQWWGVVVEDDGQEVVVTARGQVIPVVGVLTNKTAPEDFERFAELARRWYARQAARMCGQATD